MKAKQVRDETDEKRHRPGGLGRLEKIISQLIDDYRSNLEALPDDERK